MRQADLKTGLLDAASEPEEERCLMRQANLRKGVLGTASEPEEGDA